MREIINLVEGTDVNSPYFKRWFTGSKVVDAKGQPLLCYHGTDKAFHEFHAWSHFGTVGAATAIITGGGKPNANIHPVYLCIHKPLEVSDEGGVGAVSAIEKLEQMGLVTHEEWQAWCVDGGPEDPAINARRVMEQHGFDGLVYENWYEDEGSTSWVVLHPSQVWSVYRP